MVFDPKHPHRGPSVVPNSYILTSKDGANFADMIREINDLINKEGRQKDVALVNQMPAIGVAVLNADAAFAEKIKKLPSVGSVEPEHNVHIQKKKKHGGPTL